MIDELDILTGPEVATLLKVSERYVYLLLQRGEIPSLRLGRSVRVRRSDLVAWLNLRIQNAPIEAGGFSITPTENTEQGGALAEFIFLVVFVIAAILFVLAVTGRVDVLLALL